MLKRKQDQINLEILQYFRKQFLNADNPISKRIWSEAYANYLDKLFFRINKLKRI